MAIARGRKVKNLGWLLRNWKEVERFDVRPGPGFPSEAHLIAHLRGGDTYETPFASLSVLHNFLNRPVFRGLTVHWLGMNAIIGKGSDYKNLKGA